MSGATHSSQRGLHIGASQVRIPPIIKLQVLFGGKIGEARQTHTGETIYWWRVGSAAKVKEIVPQLLPYLVVKKREAEIILAFADTVRRRGRPNREVVHHTSLDEVRVRRELIEELKGIRSGGDRHVA